MPAAEITNRSATIRWDLVDTRMAPRRVANGCKGVPNLAKMGGRIDRPQGCHQF